MLKAIKLCLYFMKKQVLNDENKMTEVVIVKLSLISQIEVMQVISEN